jgi:uncharacterized membrane protein
MMYGLYNDYWGGNMMGWFGGGIMMILFWAAIIFFIVWLVRETKGHHTDESRSKSALDILREEKRFK